MRKTIAIFSSLILCLLLLFQLSKYTVFRDDLSIEVAIAVIAIVFFFVGVLLNKRSLEKRKVNETAGVDFHKVRELQISNREYDVLLALAEGLSNKEIAEKLFISESTTKTHVSKLLAKLGASKRLDAVRKAQTLHII